MLTKNTTILFQGDSITDAWRDREYQAANEPQSLGHGYVNLIAAQLLRQRPQDKLKIYNRGISGDRIIDMYARWKIDGVNLKPDVISILIGVNDTWHAFNGNNGVEVERYETLYRQMLTYTRSLLPAVKFVLCDPFLLPCGEVKKAWYPEIQQRQQVVKQLATEFAAVHVPFQEMFDAALKTAPAAYWGKDGIHPSAAGYQLMAEEWLRKVC